MYDGLCAEMCGNLRQGIHKFPACLLRRRAHHNNSAAREVRTVPAASCQTNLFGTGSQLFFYRVVIDEGPCLLIQFAQITLYCVRRVPTSLRAVY